MRLSGFEETTAGFALAVILLLGLLAVMQYRRYLRISGSSAFLWAMGVGAICMGVPIWRWARGDALSREMGFGRSGSVNFSLGVQFADGKPAWIVLIFWALMCYLAGALAGKFYLVWVMGRGSEEERASGQRGIQTWLGPANLAVGGGFVVMVGALYGVSAGVAMGVAVGAMLLAYPVLRMSMNSSGNLNVKEFGMDDTELADERRRVLALVETGKISGEDGAELIGALSQRRAAAPVAAPVMSGARRLMLAGGGLVLVGFFLPWFEVNVTQALHDGMAQMTSSMTGMFSGMTGGMAPNGLPMGFHINGMNGGEGAGQTDWIVQVHGGDIHYGLGWLILAVGVAAALLPLVWPTDSRNMQNQRMISLVGLGVASAVLVYLMADAGSAIRVGAVAVLAGYLVLWMGVLRNYAGRVGAAVV